MKQTVVLWIMLMLVPVVAGCAAQQPDLPAEELLRLGEQYLLELDYEQALAQFLKVVELEPMNPRGYTGAAEAYVGLGDPENAIDILEQGAAVTGEERLLELAGRLIRGEPLNLNWDGEALLEEMYEVFASDGVEKGLEAFSALGRDTIDNFRKDAPTIYLSPEGRGIGVYYTAENENRNARYFLYYGEYNEHERSGEGFWSNVSRFDYRFYGTWQNDLPNGYGEAGYESRYHGTLKDGLWDGEVWYHAAQENQTQMTQLFFEQGYVQVLEVLGESGKEVMIVSHKSYHVDNDGNILHEFDRIRWHEDVEKQLGISGIAGDKGAWY